MRKTKAELEAGPGEDEVKPRLGSRVGERCKLYCGDCRAELSFWTVGSNDIALSFTAAVYAECGTPGCKFNGTGSACLIGETAYDVPRLSADVETFQHGAGEPTGGVVRS